jgi:hypothetical protein
VVFVSAIASQDQTFTIAEVADETGVSAGDLARVRALGPAGDRYPDMASVRGDTKAAQPS